MLYIRKGFTSTHDFFTYEDRANGMDYSPTNKPNVQTEVRQQMTTYSDTVTIGDARAQYFAENNFGDGGYTASWVKVQAGPIPIYFPNTAARVRAVRFHDLHHVATGYDTTWTGEAEIGAWEVASGCAHHYAAWQPNLQAMAIGLVIAPQAVYRAFMRGRYTKNLYQEEFTEGLLSPTVGDLRQRLHLTALLPQPTPSDHIAFVGWAGTSVLTLVSSLAAVLAPIVGLAMLIF